MYVDIYACMYINKEYEYIYISNSFQWKSLEDNQSEHTKAQISVYNYHWLWLKQ